MSGATKNDQGKAALALIPYCAQKAEAEAFMVGAKKYGLWNFTKGHEASRLVSALLRHANAWFSGEETDPVDGQHHLGSVRACAAMILRQQELGTLIDDRYKSELESDVLSEEDKQNIDKFLQDNSELIDDIADEKGQQILVQRRCYSELYEAVPTVHLDNTETLSACGNLQEAEGQKK